jgi:alpha-beta hydrolase superfamily lysophospholipase
MGLLLREPRHRPELVEPHQLEPAYDVARRKPVLLVAGAAARRRTALTALAALAIATAATFLQACGSGDGSKPAPDPQTPPAAFYQLPAHVQALAPGAVLRSLRLSSPPAFGLWAILYHSRSAAGRDVIVSGLVAVPNARAPQGGFPVVSFGHPTTGFTHAAAPSRLGRNAYAQLFETLITRGYAIAATDYEGLGVDGPPPYEIGPSAAHSVLDAARAARALSPRSVGARLAVVGHSEGGHAALWAAQLARRYAPELDLRAVVASAPGANLPAILRLYRFSGETELNVLRLLGSWHLIYGLPLQSVLTPAGINDAERLMADQPVVGGAEPFRAPPASLPQLVRLAELNTPGAAPASAPILMLVGTADRQVPPATNVELARRLRRAGDSVTLRLLPGADHDLTLPAGGGEILSFLRARLG